MLLLGLVAFALLQLWYLNKALVMADPTIVCPLAFCFYNLSSIVNGLVYFNQFSLLSTTHLLLVVVGIVILLGGVWVVSIQAGPGVDVGTWNEDDVEEEEEVIESIQPLIFEQPASGPASPTREGPGRSESESPRASRAHRLGPLPIERQTVSESTMLPPSRLSMPTSPRSEATQTGTMLSPTRARRRRPTISGVSGEHVMSPPPTAGFSIGLSPVSPGFAIVPRERRRRVSVISTGAGTSNASGNETVRNDEGGGRWRNMVRAVGMRRTVSEGHVTRGDVEAPGEGHQEEGRGKAKGRWRWLRGLVVHERAG